MLSHQEFSDGLRSLIRKLPTNVTVANSNTDASNEIATYVHDHALSLADFTMQQKRGFRLRVSFTPEDIAQQATMSFLKSIDDNKIKIDNNDNSPANLLFSIVQGRYVDAIRSVKGRLGQKPVTHSFSDLIGRPDSTDSDVSNIADRFLTVPSTAHTQVVDAENRKILMSAINELSPKQKQVVEYRIEGIPIKEIAQRMNSCESTVKSNLHLAKKRLREILPDELNPMYADDTIRNHPHYHTECERGNGRI